MLILINGLPLFGKRLARDLKDAEPNSDFIFFDTYNSRWDQLKFIFKLPFADAVISMNGVTDRSGSMDAVLFFKKKLILQWQGTDSLMAISRFNASSICRKYIDYGYNWVDSPWLNDELKSIGLSTQHVGFKYSKPNLNVRKYSKLSVVSYISQNRQEFYGIKRLSRLALNFPDIQFDLYGISSSIYPLPSNIHLHGWVKEVDFHKALLNAPIFLRLTDHEGFPVSVIEAMSHGCEVIMSMPYSPVCVARNDQEILSSFKNILQKIDDRGLTPNQELIEIVKKDFNKSVVINNYLNILKRIVQER